MTTDEIPFHPVNQVIFESALDELMENIWRKHSLDVRSWKLTCKWLASISHEKKKGIYCTNHYISVNAILNPKCQKVHLLDDQLCVLTVTPECSFIKVPPGCETFRTPITHDARQENLFFVVSYISCECIDDVSVVLVAK